jgi:hypothetical protein
MPTSLTGVYIAGIWEKDLHRGLCWQPAGEPRYSAQHETYMAPSFSWASQTGAVNWPFTSANLQSAFRVVECKTELDGVDPFGRVRAGHLILEGKCVTVRTKRHRGSHDFHEISFRLGHLGQMYSRLVRYEGPLESTGTLGTRHDDDKELFLFLLSYNRSHRLRIMSYVVPTHIVIALELVTTTPQSIFRRIGLLGEDFDDTVFQNAETKRVTII